MRTILLQAVILLCAVSGGRLSAQDAMPGGEGRQRWTLEECIEYAREHNIQILQQELSLEDAELENLQSKLDYLPSVNASAGTGISFGRVPDETTFEIIENTSNTNMNLSASAGLDLFGGMRKLHTLRRSQLNLDATLLSIEKAKNDLALNVTAAYLDILFAEERVGISESQIATLRLQVEQSRQLVDAGKNTMSDLLQMQSQLADAEYQNILTRNQRTMAYFNLCQLLEIEDYTNFAIVAPENISIDPGLPPPSAAGIIEEAQALPQIGRAKLGVEIADRNIRLARSSYYPTLRLSGGYGSSYSEVQQQFMNFGRQLRNNANGYISLSLSVPIFNSLSARNNVRAQKTAYRRAEYDMMIVQKQLNKEIEQAVIDATGALEQYYSSFQTVLTNEESFRMIEQRYNLGAASPVDYSMALYNLTNARSQLAQAKYQYIFKSKILDFYRGEPIHLTMDN